MENTRRFEMVETVHDEDSFHRALTSGRAKVGLKIPSYYTDRMVRGEQVQVQVLIDGSDSQVAMTAQSTAQLLGLNLSIQSGRAKGEALQIAPARDPMGHAVLPIETRTRMLYNPDLESAHFFVPGLVGIILQLVTLFLTSFAIVRERELGTLEQLFVTPVGRMGLLLGKLVPYAILGFGSVVFVYILSRTLFGVPFRGNIFVFGFGSVLFLVTYLAQGLLISILTRSQYIAMQFAIMTGLLPVQLLSGFIFPIESMPSFFRYFTMILPARWFMVIARETYLKGATMYDLWLPFLILSISCALMIVLATKKFKRNLEP
jgi:ABC-type multidrug transport system permease subunit